LIKQSRHSDDILTNNRVLDRDFLDFFRHSGYSVYWILRPLFEAGSSFLDRVVESLS